MEAMRFFFNQKPVPPGGWLAEFSSKDLASPTRSTVPLLDALRSEPLADFLPALLDEADLMMEGVNLHFEYQVKAGRGRGKASHTDLMAIDAVPVSRRSLAIEAKWTEPRYANVTDWLKRGTSLDNRRQVVRGWLDQIEPHAAGLLAVDDCDGLIYQMVHRAASAAAACGIDGLPAMAYLVFHVADPKDDAKAESHLADYRADLRRFRSVIGNAEGFPFFLASVPLELTEAFRAVVDLKKGDPATGRAIRHLLAHARAPLFHFRKPRIERF